MFEKLNNTEALPEEEPTCPTVSVFPKGYGELRTKVERLFAGTARQLSFRDFGNHWNLYQPRPAHAHRHRYHHEDFSTPFVHIWMDDRGEVSLCPLSYVFSVSLFKKVGKKRYTKQLMMQETVKVKESEEAVFLLLGLTECV